MSFSTPLHLGGKYMLRFHLPSLTTAPLRVIQRVPQAIRRKIVSPGARWNPAWAPSQCHFFLRFLKSLFILDASTNCHYVGIHALDRGRLYFGNRAGRANGEELVTQSFEKIPRARRCEPKEVCTLGIKFKNDYRILGRKGFLCPAQD